MALRIGPATRSIPSVPPEAQGILPEEIEAAIEPEALPEEEEMVEPELPEEEPIEDELPLEELPSPLDEGKVDPSTATYRTPDMGPFLCGNCGYFRGESCIIVSGVIDPEGVCNLFTKAEDTEEVIEPEKDVIEPTVEEPLEME